jgi:hypothetical protein
MSTIDGYPAQLGYAVIEFLRDGTFDELIGFIEHDLGDQWKRTDPDDFATRERFYQELRSIQRLKDKLRAVADSVKFN